MTDGGVPGGGVTGGGAAGGARERLYGRRRGHGLRVRQQRLLDVTLPRLRVDPAALPVGGRMWLEIGFGGGEHAAALVAAHPDVLVVAAEVFANGICSLLGRLVAEGDEAGGALPGNLRVWDQDARPLLRALPDGCLERVYLMFPDPWPKSRHAGRRFVNAESIAEVARVLRAGGEWRVASDDPTYQGWVAAVMGAQGVFAVGEAETARPAGWHGTRYEAKALKAGRVPMYWVFRRNDVA